jgi:hypothetical protein
MEWHGLSQMSMVALHLSNLCRTLAVPMATMWMGCWMTISSHLGESCMQGIGQACGKKIGSCVPMGIRAGANCSDKPSKEKGPRAVVKCISVGAYNLHHGKHYNDRKKVVLQLVPTSIWKVYAVCIENSHIASGENETWKKRLRDNLNKRQIGKLNDM